jgi:uncharacterized protein
LEEGQVVDLYLEVYPGEGRVFIDSYPLTKMDTQVSTRFANKFACDYANIDCSKIDFVYTIRSNSPIIGGPSASAAIGALTIAKLTHSDIDESVALTGTLNSGGIIGEVGGVDKKVLAAKSAGIKKVLIPKGTIYQDDNASDIVAEIDFPLTNDSNYISNKTTSINISKEISIDITKNESITHFNWTEFGMKNKISVVEVITISDVLSEFGVTYKKKIETSKEIDKYYIETMKSLAEDLCDDARKMSPDFPNSNSTSEAYDALDRGDLFYSAGKYYSSASQCFVSLSKFRLYELKSQNLTEKEFNKTVQDTENDIDSFIIPRYTTIMDLQAYAIVKERLADAKKSLSDARQDMVDSENITDDALNNLAYGIERFNTAKSWSTFITHHGAEFKLDVESLKSACEEKVQEAQELGQYVDLYIPAGFFEISKTSLDDAKTEYYNKEYELCLFSASKSKSESSMVLSSLGVEKENIKEIINIKLSVAKDIMNSNKNSFPIVAYSYYEYGLALNDINDSTSALLYSEYALDMATMNLYFSGEIAHEQYKFDKTTVSHAGNTATITNDVTSLDTLYTFLLGLALGVMIMIFREQRSKEKELQKEHDMYIKMKRK